MIQKNYSRHIFTILLTFAIILGGFLLKITQGVVLQVLIAVLLAFVFYPIVKKLNSSLKIPWILAVLISVFVFVIIFLLLFSILFASGSTIMENYPKYEEKFATLYNLIANTLKIEFDTEKTFFQNIWSQIKVREFIQSFALTTSTGVISFFKNFLTILLLMVFLLIELKNANLKIEAMFTGNKQKGVHRIVSKTIREVVNYLSIKFFISFATAVLVFVLLLAVRLDFAILWAFLAFVLNFIPTFGSIASVGITALFALIQFWPSPVAFFIVLIGMTAINFILGNIIEPRIEGKNLDISPFIILASLTFWGWMWGFIGMILAVPVMVVLKIVCENFKILHPIAILLGNKAEDTIKELSTFEEDEETESINEKEKN